MLVYLLHVVPFNQIEAFLSFIFFFNQLFGFLNLPNFEFRIEGSLLNLLYFQFWWWKLCLFYITQNAIILWHNSPSTALFREECICFLSFLFISNLFGLRIVFENHTDRECAAFFRVHWNVNCVMVVEFRVWWKVQHYEVRVSVLFLVLIFIWLLVTRWIINFQFVFNLVLLIFDRFLSAEPCLQLFFLLKSSLLASFPNYWIVIEKHAAWWLSIDYHNFEVHHCVGYNFQDVVCCDGNHDMTVIFIAD